MNSNSRFFFSMMLVLLIIGVSGILLAASERLDLPLIHEERSRDSGGLLSVNEHADGEELHEGEHPEDEGSGRGQGRGAGGEGQGFGGQAGTGEGRNAKPEDFWTVLSNLWVIAVVTLFVIFADRISDKRRKRKGAVTS